MYYNISSIIRILMIVFLLTNKTTRRNLDDLTSQFFTFLHDIIVTQMGMPNTSLDDEVIMKEEVMKEEGTKEEGKEETKEETKEEVTKEEVTKEEGKDEVKDEPKKEEVKKEEKYEDKYLKKFKEFINEYCLTEEEKLLEKTKYDEFKDILLKTQELGLKETSTFLNKIQHIFNKGGINTNEGIEELTKYYNIEAEYDDNPDDYDLKELINELTEIRDEQQVKYEEFSIMTFSEAELKENARKYVLDKKHDGYINNYVIETTPMGNIYMRYNNSKKSFEYFSNNTIPYRFLEPVGRKYVMTYFCKPLFIDIEEELNKAQIKKDQEKEKEQIKKDQEKDGIKNGEKGTKDLFAKLKSYNKESSSVPIQMNVKNRQPNMPMPPQIKVNLPSTSSDNMLLKEHANRYTWEGRIANFSFLKKIEKKMVDKNYEMSFADFKRLQMKK